MSGQAQKDACEGNILLDQKMLNLVANACDDADCAQHVGRLIASGANPSTFYVFSRRSVLMEAMARSLEETGLVLLAAGADPHARCHEGDSAFSWAAIRAMERCLKVLAPMSDVNQRSKTGETPLMQSLRYSPTVNSGALEFLLLVSDLRLEAAFEDGAMSLGEYARRHCREPENLKLVEHALGKMRAQEEAAEIEKTLGASHRQAGARSRSI